MSEAIISPSQECFEDDSVRFVTTLQRVFMKLSELVYRQTALEKTPPSPVIETDYGKAAHERNGNVNCYGTFEGVMQKNACQHLASRIEHSLRLAKERHLQCEIRIPLELTARVAEDIIRMSDSEPYGLRGCELSILFDDGGSVKRIGRVHYDPNTVPTFELILTLQRDTRHWAQIKRLLPFAGCLGFTDTIFVSPGFTLAKKKLYRRNSNNASS